MPTSVEFQPGGAYAEQVLGRRDIPESAVTALLAKGGGTAIAEGRTIYKWNWASSFGDRWTLFGITHGTTVLTSWVEQGESAMALLERPLRAGAVNRSPAVHLEFIGGAGQQYYGNTDHSALNWYQNVIDKSGTSQKRPAEKLVAWTGANAKDDKIAWSIQLEPLVVADFAANGNLVGIEFIGKRDRPIESYVDQAVALGGGVHRQLVPGNSKWEALTFKTSLSTRAITFRP